MTNLQPPENTNNSSTEVTLNGRQITNKIGKPLLVSAGVAATAVAVGSTAVAVFALGALVLFGGTLIGVALSVLVTVLVLSLPAIFITDKVLKRAGRKGFIQGQTVNGRFSGSIVVSAEGFQKIPQGDGWTIVVDNKD